MGIHVTCTESGEPVDVDALVAAFEKNPEAKAAFLESVMDGLGIKVGKWGAMPTLPPLPTKTELAARIRAVITATLNAHSVAVHRDAVHYLVEALADELYVAPPVDPEDVKGVG